jgi:hypothetical protein
MKLYSVDLSPYSARVRMQIYAKGLSDIAIESPTVLAELHGGLDERRELIRTRGFENLRAAASAAAEERPRGRPSMRDQQPIRLLSRRTALATATAGLGLALFAVARGESLSSAELAKTCALALKRWRAGFARGGLVGLEAESRSCFSALQRAPTQHAAVYCAALDHFSLLDSMNFPQSLRPPYFSTDAVFSRYDKIIALSTPPAERAWFASRLLVTLDETLHNSH